MGTKDERRGEEEEKEKRRDKSCKVVSEGDFQVSSKG